MECDPAWKGRAFSALPKDSPKGRGSLFGPKINRDYDGFMARVALEVGNTFLTYTDLKAN
jgi:hypothetical protein